MNNSKLRSRWSAGYCVYFRRKKKNQHNNHINLYTETNMFMRYSKNQVKSFFDRFVQRECCSFTINNTTKTTLALIVTLLVWRLLQKFAAISIYSTKEKNLQRRQEVSKTHNNVNVFTATLRSIYCIWPPVSSGLGHNGSASHPGHSGPIPMSVEHSGRWFPDSPETPRHSRASGCRRCRSSDRAGYSTWSWREFPRQTGNRQMWDGLQLTMVSMVPHLQGNIMIKERK